MNLKQAIERMRELFPGKYTTAEIKITNLSHGEEVQFRVYAEPAMDGQESFQAYCNSGFPSLIAQAEIESQRRNSGIVLSLPSASEAADCVTNPPTETDPDAKAAADELAVSQQLDGEQAERESRDADVDF